MYLPRKITFNIKRSFNYRPFINSLDITANSDS